MEKNESGLLLCDDLIFSSKIAATARAHHLNLRVCKSVEALLALKDSSPAVLILELDHSDFDVEELLRQFQPRPRVIAYGSHVNVERLKAARKAGCDLVLPRSAFVEKLESDLPAWFTPSSSG